MALEIGGLRGVDGRPMKAVTEMSFGELVDATPSLGLDIMDGRPMAERLTIHRALVDEATRRGVLEKWSYAVRTR